MLYLRLSHLLLYLLCLLLSWAITNGLIDTSTVPGRVAWALHRPGDFLRLRRIPHARPLHIPHARPLHIPHARPRRSRLAAMLRSHHARPSQGKDGASGMHSSPYPCPSSLCPPSPSCPYPPSPSGQRSLTSRISACCSVLAPFFLFCIDANFVEARRCRLVLWSSGGVVFSAAGIGFAMVESRSRRTNHGLRTNHRDSANLGVGGQIGQSRSNHDDSGESRSANHGGRIMG